jgi:predicted DNA binding CopG/RHH family protein
MKKVPEFNTDAEVEAFLEKDLSGIDFNQFKPMRFEVAKKESSLNMRLPAVLMDAVRAKAKAHGIPYSRYIRMVLEGDLKQESFVVPEKDISSHSTPASRIKSETKSISSSKKIRKTKKIVRPKLSGKANKNDLPKKTSLKKSA